MVFNIYHNLAWGVTAQALELKIVGIVAMIAGYYLFPGLPLAHSFPRVARRLDFRRLSQFIGWRSVWQFHPVGRSNGYQMSE